MTTRFPHILLVTFCLLAVTTSANAECACVLWERQTIDRETTDRDGGDVTTWRRVESFGTDRACQGATNREARLKTCNRLPLWKTRALNGPRVVISSEWETETFAYECLPDTVDQRGPKGK